MRARASPVTTEKSAEHNPAIVAVVPGHTDLNTGGDHADIDFIFIG